MADWFDTIEIFDEIAFDDGPLETPTTWYDISDSVLSFRSFVGKTSLDTEFAPGYASLRLDNSEGHFTPQNTLGDYYPNVKPMRRYRRRVMVEATEYVVFTGYVLSWDQDWRARTSYVDVPLVDGSRLVENTPLGSAAFESIAARDGATSYWPLQIDFNDARGTQPLTPFPFWTTPDVPFVERSVPISSTFALAGIHSTSEDLNSFVVASRTSVTTAPRTIEFWAEFSDTQWAGPYIPNEDFDQLVRIAVDTTNGMEIAAINDDGATTRGFYVRARNADLAVSFHLSGVSIPSGMHHYAATVDGSSLKFYIDGIEVDSSSSGVGTTTGDCKIVAFDGSYVSNVAYYSTTLTATEIFDHFIAGSEAFGSPGSNEFGGARIGRILDDVGFPAGLRDLDDGQTIHGPYLPAGLGLLDYLRQIERAEQGLLYFGGDGSVTFRDRATLSGGAGTVIFSDDIDDITAGAVEYTSGNPRGNPIDWIRNIVTASYASTGGITRRDTTSVTDYGEARQVLDTPTLPDGRAASNLAAYVLRERKDPKSLFPALTVEMRPNTIDKMHELFGLEIGSVVTVRRTPFDLPYEVEETGILLGMEHDNPGESGQWYMTLYLAPAPTQYNDADTPLLRVGSGDDTNLIGAAAGNIIIA